MTRKFPEPQAGSKTRIFDMRFCKFKSLRALSPACSNCSRRSSRKSGFRTFKIFGTLKTGTDRYRCENSDQVIDLGLRLKDVEESGLEWESTRGLRHSELKLAEWGATDDEIAALNGSRVELNAFTSGDLIDWIECKLDEHGVKKIVPDRATLESAYRRATEIENVERAMDEAAKKIRDRAEEVDIPDDLEEQVRERLEKDPSCSWDAVVAELVADSE